MTINGDLVVNLRENSSVHPFNSIPAPPVGFVQRAAPENFANFGEAILISGGPGMGKTSLARSISHSLLGENDFGIEVSMVDSTVGSDSGAVLREILHALGYFLDDDEISSRSLMFAKLRKILGRRRAVILVDDVVDETMLRAVSVLPENIAVVATSRQRLSAVDIRCHELGILSKSESIDLLSGLTGENAIQEDPEAAGEIVDLCQGLPIAVYCAGKLLANAEWGLRHVASRLKRATNLFAELRVGDRGVWASFAVSFDHLRPALRRTLSLAVLVPGGGFDASMLQSIDARSLAKVESDVEELADWGLIQRAAKPGRYQFHSILMECALEASRQMFSEIKVAELELAAANELLAAFLERSIPLIRRAETGVESDNSSQIDSWVDERLDNIVAGIFRLGTAHPNSSRAIRAAMVVGLYCDHRSLWHVAIDVFDRLDDSAKGGLLLSDFWGDGSGFDGGRRVAIAVAMGFCEWNLALGAVDRCDRMILRLSDEASDEIASNRMIQFNIESLRGRVFELRGEFMLSLRSARSAEKIAVEMEDENSFMVAIYNQGNMLAKLGRERDGIRYLQAEISYNESRGNIREVAKSLNGLGNAYSRMGESAKAFEVLMRAAMLLHEQGFHRYAANSLFDLGVALLADERIALARDVFQAELTISRMLGDRFQEVFSESIVDYLDVVTDGYFEPRLLDLIDEGIEMGKSLGALPYVAQLERLRRDLQRRGAGSLLVGGQKGPVAAWGEVGHRRAWGRNVGD